MGKKTVKKSAKTLGKKQMKKTAGGFVPVSGGVFVAAGDVNGDTPGTLQVKLNPRGV